MLVLVSVDVEIVSEESKNLSGVASLIELSTHITLSIAATTNYMICIL